MTTHTLARFGALLSDRSRAEMLSALLDGRAYTSGELARFAGIGASTASEHLGKLAAAGLVVVESQGRHRYYRLRDADVADLLESIASSPAAGSLSAGSAGSPDPPERTLPDRDLAYLRTCYDHLAGELAVRIYDQMVAGGHLVEQEDRVDLTTSGRALLDALATGPRTEAAAGSPSSRRPVARPCLDWSQRRRHLAGRAGADLLAGLLAQHWVVPTGRPRRLRITGSGHDAIPRHFSLTL